MWIDDTSRRGFVCGGAALAAAAFAAGSVECIARPMHQRRNAAGADGLDLLIGREMEARGIAGLAIAVLQHGRMVKAAGYGIADLEQRVPVSAHTRFHLDSLSKLFSAVAVVQLVEAGRVSLEDPIGRWLDGLQPGWSGITVRHLLTHSSGI